MKKSVLLGMMLTLLLIAVSSQVFNFNLAKAMPRTIFVQAHEFVVPSTTSTSDSAISADEYVPGEVLVGFIDVINGTIITECGGTLQESVYEIATALVKVTPGSEDGFINAVTKYTKVKFAERNGYCTTQYVPADPGYQYQKWNYELVKAPKAWDVTRGSSSITIAVIDSGVNATHPDLNANVVGGYDFVNKDSDPSDDLGHGTCVAGIIAAEMDNPGEDPLNDGTGIAPACRIMPVKVMNATGSGKVWNITLGIIYAAINGANIINLSLGRNTPSYTLHEACDYAYFIKRRLLVAAAGNGNPGQPVVCYPARYESVIAVSAIDANAQRASYSNYGSEIELCAPGGGDLNNDGDCDDANEYVYSTLLSGGYGGAGFAFGTSMAAPHVSGVAALVWSVYGSLTNEQVRELLRTTADDLLTPGWDPQTGYGLVNAEAVLPPEVVGGVFVSVDKFGLLFPHIGLTLTVLAATVVTAVCVRRVKRAEEKQ
jgi:serine protease